MLRGTFSPTATPSMLPTLAPTASSCADGFHGCDTSSTICMSVDAQQGHEPITIISCICLEGYYPNPNDGGSCLTAAEATVAAKEGGSPSMVPTLEPTAATPVPTVEPTHMATAGPTRQACVDGNYGCDLQSSRCVIVTVGEFFLTSCQCLEGFKHAENSTLACVLVTAAPTPVPEPAEQDVLEKALWTPAPTAPAPAPNHSDCDPHTTVQSFAKFCPATSDDRDLSLWTYPGSEGTFCGGASIEKVTSLLECVRFCQNMGGPPR
jgi:hypothetical protein